MTRMQITRRTTLLGLSATLGLALQPRSAISVATPIRVVKDPDCGCCAAWIKILEAEGFVADVELLEFDALLAHRVASGIPADKVSCHTAHVDGFAALLRECDRGFTS